MAGEPGNELTWRSFTAERGDFDVGAAFLARRSFRYKLKYHWPTQFFLIALGYVACALVGKAGAQLFLQIRFNNRFHVPPMDWGQLLSAGAFGIAIAVMCVAFIQLRRRREISQMLKEQHELLGSQEFAIADDGFRVRNEVSSELWPWSKLLGIEEYAGHFFFLVTERNGVNIPPRAFSSNGEAKEFFATAQTLWAGTRLPEQV